MLAQELQAEDLVPVEPVVHQVGELRHRIDDPPAVPDEGFVEEGNRVHLAVRQSGRAPDHDIGALGQCRLHQQRIAVFGDHIIGIHQGDVLALRQGNAQVAHDRPAFVGFGQAAEIPMTRLIGPADGQAVVGAAVIDGDDLDVRIALVQQGIEALLQVLRSVVDQHDDGKQRLHPVSPSTRAKGRPAQARQSSSCSMASRSNTGRPRVRLTSSRSR
ncbi:hypothetical protein D3C84_434760 [compost metagenome]